MANIISHKDEITSEFDVEQLKGSPNCDVWIGDFKILIRKWEKYIYLYKKINQNSNSDI